MFVFLERWQTVSFRNEKARNTTSDKHETACTSAYIIERQVINVRINGSWEEGGEKKKKKCPPVELLLLLAEVVFKKKEKPRLTKMSDARSRE